MEILRLLPADAERFREIRLRSLKDAPTSFNSRYEDVATWPADTWPRQLQELATFVAVRDGRDVGVVRSTALEGVPGAAILRSMWVAAEARGQGVGEALIDTVVGWARGEGFSRLVLDVADHNAPAVALYARKGFVRMEERIQCGAGPAHRRVLELGGVTGACLR